MPMKIYRLILIFICLLVSVKVYAQESSPVTISFRNAPLETVLAQIKKQTGISFFYNKEVVASAGKISVQAEKKDLKTVLELCLNNTPITYNIIGNIVVLVNKSAKKNPDGTIDFSQEFFSQNAVHGVVADVKGIKVNGAGV